MRLVTPYAVSVCVIPVRKQTVHRSILKTCCKYGQSEDALNKLQAVKRRGVRRP